VNANELKFLNAKNLADTQTNADITISVTGKTSARHVALGLTISANTAPSSSLTAELRSASNVLRRIQIPAAAFPAIRINYPYGVFANSGEALSLVVSGSGKGATFSVDMDYGTVR